MRPEFRWPWTALTLAVMAAPCVGLAAEPPQPDRTPPSQALDAEHWSTVFAYHWRLVDARDRSGRRIGALLDHGWEPAQLDLTEPLGASADPVASPGSAIGGLEVTNICNDWPAGFRRVGDGIEIVESGPTTLELCSESTMILADGIRMRLYGHLGLTVAAGNPPRLTVRAANGDELTFEGAPTPATRYGSTGERLHLEVAPRRVSCVQPAVPDGRCLQVRRLHYGADGRRLPADSEWMPLHQEIEGFTHEEGIRYVVDLQRFELKRRGAGGLSYAYVLRHIPESDRGHPPVPPGRNEPGTIEIRARK